MTESTTLDVTQIEPRYRHPMIFGRYGDMGVGDSFVLMNDHDPKPLRYQFAAEYPDAFEWEYLEAGPEIWKVKITKRRAAEAVVTPQPGWAAKKPDITLDVRDLIARNEEPFQLIMETENSVKEGQVFLLINSFKPAPLVGIMERKGYESYMRDGADGSVETLFLKKAKGKSCGIGGC